MLNHLERINLFYRDMSGDFLHDVVGALGTLYRETYEETSQLPGDFQRYLRPHLLRTKAEIAFLTLAHRYNLATHVQYNRSRDAHVRVLSDNFILTLSRTPGPNEPPRSAQFRSNYASLGQYWLPLPEFANEQSPIMVREDDPRLYVVIAHGPQVRMPRELGFVWANFVSDNPRAYWGQGVDLRTRFAPQSIGQEIEEVQEPTFLPQVEEKSQGGEV